MKTDLSTCTCMIESLKKLGEWVMLAAGVRRVDGEVLVIVAVAARDGIV